MAEFVLFRMLMIATAIAGTMILVPGVKLATKVFHK